MLTLAQRWITLYSLFALVALAGAAGLSVLLIERPQTAITVALPTSTPAPAGGDVIALTGYGAAPPVQATPEPLRVRVWWPDELYPDTDEQAEALLLRQLDGFRQTYQSYELEVRRKRSSGLGSILSTLRAASPVAPGALPDLALMRRADMVSAAEEGLLVPIADWVPSEILESNLLPGAQALGEVDGTLYGVPYALTLTHNLYRASEFDEPLRAFSDVLRESPAYRFPGGSGPSAAVNTTVLLQYLHAGGRLADANGAPVLDRAPLLTVLQYYATGATQGIFDAELLEYTQPASYWNAFASGELNLIGIDSTVYLARRAEMQAVGLAPIPTHDGEPITALNGWVWVLVTQDPDRQNRARAFLSWMMRVSQQAALTEVLRVIPTQERALALWDDEAYAEFAAALIPHGEIIPTAQRSGSAAAALQDSFANVLRGMPPTEAAEAAITSLMD